MGKKPSFAEGTSRYMHGRLQQKGRHYFRKKADDRNGGNVQEREDCPRHRARTRFLFSAPCCTRG